MIFIVRTFKKQTNRCPGQTNKQTIKQTKRQTFPVYTVEFKRKYLNLQSFVSISFFLDRFLFYNDFSSETNFFCCDHHLLTSSSPLSTSPKWFLHNFVKIFFTNHLQKHCESWEFLFNTILYIPATSLIVMIFGLCLRWKLWFNTSL